MNKIFLLTFLVLSLSGTAFSQQPVVDSLQKRIETLERLLNDKNYSRVPNVDLDKSLDYIVTEKISSKILFWMTAIGAVFAFAGFSGLAVMKNIINNEAEKTIKQNYKEFETVMKDMKAGFELKLKEQKEGLEEENSKQDESIKVLNEQVTHNLQKLTEFRDETSKSIDERFSDSLKMIWNDIADSKQNRAKELNFKGDDLINELKEFLESKTISVSRNKTVLLVDSLMRCYYGAKKYKEMIELLKKYEKDFNMLPETYANAAIALSDNYERYGLKSDLTTGLECCDKSIEELPDYGTAYAVKLGILMVSHEKAFDEKDKKEILEKIERSFKDIENVQSPDLPFSILDRFNLDKDPNIYIAKYILQLEQLFADDIQVMKKKVCDAIVTNPGFMKAVNFRDSVDRIMRENAALVPELQGNWKAVKVTESGVETDPDKIDVQLSFNQYVYKLRAGSIVDDGYALFLPFKNKQSEIYFYKMKDKDTFEKLIPAVYKFENNQTTICSNYFSAEKPDGFVSTKENKYFLEIYERASIKS